MKLKKNKAGKLQYYDSKGRYAKMPNSIFSYNQDALFAKQRKQQKEAIKKEILLNKAMKSKDKYLRDVFIKLIKELPNSIVDVNVVKYDKVHSKNREIDIITQKHIIEIKSGKYKGRTNQYLEQQNYARSINKRAIVYAPEYSYYQLRDYTKNGILITNNINVLIQMIKEIEK